MLGAVQRGHEILARQEYSDVLSEVYSLAEFLYVVADEDEVAGSGTDGVDNAFCV